MAPPKRRSSGGRVTPKGTRPGQVTAMAKEAPHHDSSVARSSRYTPPTPKEFYESPTWVPVLMFVFVGIGILCIISRYIVPAFDNTNTPVLIGLGFLLAGLFTATKWR
ncbi:MAG TPA: cell division protein CrgA [Ilumatobacteraceae bacterium]|nr:cell division protein CrgA [Ilumatobacteraceae bacterium]HUC32486.1 cell division protein CrgA [Ilumatobacteraceae bacterium]